MLKGASTVLRGPGAGNRVRLPDVGHHISTMRHATALVLLLLPSLAFANLVWPAVYVTIGLVTWWVIAAGLAIETIGLSLLLKASFAKSFLLAFFMNAISAVLGVVLVPLAGIAYELWPGLLINWLFSWGTFNPVAWVATFLLAAVINAAVEGTVLAKGFAISLSRNHRLWLIALNFATVALAVWPAIHAFRSDA